MFYSYGGEDNDNPLVIDQTARTNSEITPNMPTWSGNNPQIIKIMGTHHKTGTLLLSLILKDIHKIIHPRSRQLPIVDKIYPDMHKEDKRDSIIDLTNINITNQILLNGTKDRGQQQRSLFTIANNNSRLENDIIMGYFGPLEKQDSQVPFSFRDLRCIYEESENPHKAHYDDIAAVFALGIGKDNEKVLDELTDEEDGISESTNSNTPPNYSSYRLVHVVRDPIDVVVSAYLFHKSGPPFYAENWLFEQNKIEHFGKILQPQDDYKINPSSCTISKMVQTKEDFFLPILYREKERIKEAIEELSPFKDTDLFLSYRTVGEEKQMLTAESVAIDKLIEDAIRIIALGQTKDIEDNNKEETETLLREEMRISWFEILNCLDDEEGIHAEAEFQNYFGAISTMYTATDYYNKVFTKKEEKYPGYILLSSPKQTEVQTQEDQSMVLTVKYEEIMRRFDETFYKIFDFLGSFTEEELQIIIKVCQKHDLSRQSKEELNANVHVTSFKDTNSQIKNQLRELVINYSEKHEDFRSRRRTIGYY